MTHTFRVHNLGCIRQHNILFSDLQFEILSGELLLITGPNGVGKSSLLRLLTGLALPLTGEILWHGETIQKNRASYAEQFHYLNHVNGCKLDLTVKENLQLACQIHDIDLKKNISQVLATLALSAHENSIVRQLSAGQKRRVALAKLLLLPKPLWILDEPLTAIDTDTQQLFLAELKKHLQQGGLAIISSHHDISVTDINIKQLRLSAC